MPQKKHSDSDAKKSKNLQLPQKKGYGNDYSGSKKAAKKADVSRKFSKKSGNDGTTSGGPGMQEK